MIVIDSSDSEIVMETERLAMNENEILIRPSYLCSNYEEMDGQVWYHFTQTLHYLVTY